MKLPLKLGELMEFEELTGVSFDRFDNMTRLRLCQVHRLKPSTSEEIQECPDCEQPKIPLKVIAVLGWQIQRREEPKLTYESFINSADIEDTVDALGKLFAAAQQKGSNPSTAAGEPPSSTGTPVSPRRVTPTSKSRRGKS